MRENGPADGEVGEGVGELRRRERLSRFRRMAKPALKNFSLSQIDKLYFLFIFFIRKMVTKGYEN